MTLVELTRCTLVMLHCQTPSERQPCYQVKREYANRPTAPALTFQSSVGVMCQKDAA